MKNTTFNGPFHRKPTHTVRCKGVDIPCFGPQKSRSFMDQVSAKGLRSAGLVVITIASAILLAWVSIEAFVQVNFWGTIFAAEPLIEEGLDFVNIKSIEYKGISLDSMPNVCPDCAGCLATGHVVVSGNTVYASVECGCGYKGREEYSMSSYTAWAADANYEGEEPEGSIVCPCCLAAVVLPVKAQMDYDCLDLEATCSFCGASVEASISCNFEGNIALPMPA